MSFSTIQAQDTTTSNRRNPRRGALNAPLIYNGDKPELCAPRVYKRRRSESAGHSHALSREIALVLHACIAAFGSFMRDNTLDLVA